MVAVEEIYTPGYSAVAVRYMMRRHAARDAAFVLPRLRPGMRLLDCGCGPGTISVGLAEIVSPGEVVGIDVDEGQVALARQHADAGTSTNVRIEAANVYDLPFEPRSFDAVFAHALFEHLARPLLALNQIRRVLRPGGFIAVSSPDWAGNVVSPPDPLVDEAIEHFKQLQIRNGGNPYVGRHLGELLAEAGFSRVALAATYDCYEDVGLFAELISQRIEAGGSAGGAGMETNGTTKQRLCQALREWASGPSVLFAQTLVSAIGYAAE